MAAGAGAVVRQGYGAVKTAAYKLGSVVDESLALNGLDGKKLSFKDLRGKVVLIHFWSTQCPYETVADPKFVELEKRWKDQKDVVILAINANSSEIGEAPLNARESATGRGVCAPSAGC